MVLKSNKPVQDEGSSEFLTACIRLPIVYGERGLVSIPGALTALEEDRTGFQLGDGSNMWDFASAGNAGIAHVLLAKAFITQHATPSTTKVDGEAFNITDGERHRFWDFPRTIWKAAGWEPLPNEHTRVLFSTLALGAAIVMEWLYWIFTLGTKRPGLFSRQQVEYACFTHSYNIEKAKERLGYALVAEFEEGITRAVKWSLDHDGWAARMERRNISPRKSK